MIGDCSVMVSGCERYRKCIEDCKSAIAGDSSCLHAYLLHGVSVRVIVGVYTVDDWLRRCVPLCGQVMHCTSVVNHQMR